MEKLIERILERAGLSEEELSSCGSVNLPDAAKPFLDLTPAQVVALVRAGDLDGLAASSTVWLSGWEPNEKLRRLLDAVRGVLMTRPATPSAGRFYRRVGDQFLKLGRISHAQLLSWNPDNGDEPATCAEERLALRLRGKIKGRIAPADDLDGLRKKLSGGADEPS